MEYFVFLVGGVPQTHIENDPFNRSAESRVRQGQVSGSFTGQFKVSSPGPGCQEKANQMLIRVISEKDNTSRNLIFLFKSVPEGSLA